MWLVGLDGSVALLGQYRSVAVDSDKLMLTALLDSLSYSCNTCRSDVFDLY